MLTAMSLSLALSIFLVKLKKSKEVMIMVIMMMNFIFIMKYPTKDLTFMLSNNYMLDTLSMMMMILTMWIIPLMISSSYSTKKMFFMFMTTIMMMLIILINLFSTKNMIMFYILFESSIIPILMLIMFWGNQPERKTASFFIMMYTISASLPLLIMLISLMKTNFHMNMSFMGQMLPLMFNKYISWLMLTLAFLIKLPLFSLHMWLPKAHVEAPLAGSMVLAAILLKLGGYGLLRMNKISNMNIMNMSNIILSMSIMGSLITSVMCMRQTDLKSLIAYSSVAHMSLMMIGLISSSKLGMYGSLIIMLTHGLTSSCMFFLTNMMYEKMNSRNILLMKGMLLMAPMVSMMWMITSIFNMAMPPSLNIFGEIIIMMSSLKISKIIMMLLMISSFTTAMYSLYMYSMINHGNLLKMANPMLQTNSMTMTNWLSHSWPLVILLISPSNLMKWC